MTRCPNCFIALTEAARECPNGHPLLANWTDHPSTCLAMAGARSTGKSVYIGVMLKQLVHFGEGAGITVSPATDKVAQSFAENYERPLYEQRNIVKATVTEVGNNVNPHQREPLIFVLHDRNGRRHHLVIRDVAGEDLEPPPPPPEPPRPPLNPEKFRFFENADGVVFMFDPLRVPEIARSLSDLFPVQRTGGDPVAVLRNTLELIGRGSPRLAVVVSKFDAMQELRRVDRPDWRRIMGNAGAAIYRDPGWSGPYNEADGELLHEEVRSLLHFLRSSQIPTTLEAAAHQHGLTYRYFAVSALGEAPDGPAQNPRGIAPFRCLDPLRWTMAGSGFL